MESNVSETIQKLKNEKRILARKLLELSNTFKASMARIEKKFEDKIAINEERLDKLENTRIDIEMKGLESSTVNTKVRDLEKLIDIHGEEITELKSEKEIVD